MGNLELKGRLEKKEPRCREGRVPQAGGQRVNNPVKMVPAVPAQGRRVGVGRVGSVLVGAWMPVWRLVRLSAS